MVRFSGNIFSRIVFTGLLIILQSTFANAQFYQGSQMTFGKNRVQYTDFYWTYYKFKNYDVYFYVGGKELAAYVAEQAQNEMDDLERLLDYRSTNRFQIIVYNKLSDLKQTNIGLEMDDLSYNIGGLTRVIGNKILIYFDGNHEHLQQQIRAGMARALLDQLMYGGNIRERLQASILLNLPLWFNQGLVTYLAKGWTVEDDNRLRDLLLSHKIKSMSQLMEMDEVFAGQALWKYIMDTYGQASLSNLVYMTRINRSLESGFVYVLGTPLRQLSKDWYKNSIQHYEQFDKDKLPVAGSPLQTKERKKILTQAAPDPFGSRVAYVANNKGKYKVRVYDVQNNKRYTADC